MTSKYTFEELGYKNTELNLVVNSLKLGSIKMNNDELDMVRYKVYFDAVNPDNSVVKISGDLKSIISFSTFLFNYKESAQDRFAA